MKIWLTRSTTRILSVPFYKKNLEDIYYVRICSYFIQNIVRTTQCLPSTSSSEKDYAILSNCRNWGKNLDDVTIFLLNLTTIISS
jgi:ppGpp synthetase/RelA/SpoT-type nucleotidyltranferase